MRVLFSVIIFILSGFSLQAQFFSWARQIGGAGEEVGYSVAVNANKEQYITGSFSGTVDFDPGTSVYNLTSNGDQDAFVLKLDRFGNFLWVRQFGSSSTEYGKSIVVDAEGNIIVTGGFNGSIDLDPGPANVNYTTAGLYDFFICKLDESGNFLWGSKWGGTSKEDFCNGITVDTDGNIYAVGSFYGNVDFDPSISVNVMSASYIDAFVFKLNSSGKLVWAKKMGGSYREVSTAVTVDANGYVYITGDFRGLNSDFDPGPGTFYLNTYGDSDQFICKLDSFGNFVWATQLTSAAYDFSTPKSISVDINGNVYTAGAFEGYTDFDPGTAVVAMRSNGYFDGYITKFDASGNFLWAKNLGGCANTDYATCLKLDNSGNVYITGIFQYVGDFDPGPGIFNLTGIGNIDIYLVKLTSNGDFIWAKNIGGGYNDLSYDMHVDAVGNIYLLGTFSSGVDFDFGSNVFGLLAAGGNDIFIQKIVSIQESVLPVQFVQVKAIKQNSNIRIEWMNANEKDIENYTIERSTNNQQFQKIGQLDTIKNNGSDANYFFIDMKPERGDNLYRIVAREQNGKNLYSPVVKITNEIPERFISVYPNPVINRQFVLHTNNLPQDNYILSIYNLQGHRIEQRRIKINSMSSAQVIKLSPLVSPGIYQLELSAQNMRINKSIMIR